MIRVITQHTWQLALLEIRKLKSERDSLRRQVEQFRKDAPAISRERDLYLRRWTEAAFRADDMERALAERTRERDEARVKAAERLDEIVRLDNEIHRLRSAAEGAKR